MTQHKDWFGVDVAKRAARVRSRPLSRVLMELVSNSLDAGATKIELSYGRMDHPRGANGLYRWEVRCTDNGRGCDKPEVLRRVGSSTSDLHPETRGRFGQGLIDFISTCLFAEVVTLRNRLDFDKRGCEVSRCGQVNPGMSIYAVVQHPEKEIADGLLHFIILPAGVELRLNGQFVVAPRPVQFDLQCRLMTVLYDEQMERVKSYRRETKVEILPAAGLPMIYELGMPVDVMPWALPFDVNVLQKTPLDVERDTLPLKYKESLLAQLAPLMAGEYEANIKANGRVPDELLNSAELAVSMPESTQDMIARETVGAPPEKVVRRNPFDADDRSESQELEIRGFTPVNMAALPNGVRALLRSSTQTVAEAHDMVCKPSFGSGALLAPTEHQNKCLKFWCWLASGALGKDISCGLHSSSNTVAAFSPGLITWNIKEASLWRSPAGVYALGTLIHECAHDTVSGHSMEFCSAVEAVGARLALFIAKNHAEFNRQVAALEVSGAR